MKQKVNSFANEFKILKGFNVNNPQCNGMELGDEQITLERVRKLTPAIV